MCHFLKELAEVQGHIAEMRRLALLARTLVETEAMNWMADELEDQARELDGII